jgi:hypothetical protein
MSHESKKDNINRKQNEDVTVEFGCSGASKFRPEPPTSKTSQDSNAKAEGNSQKTSKDDNKK